VPSNLAQAKSLLKEVKGKQLAREERIRHAIQLATFIQNEANLCRAASERAYGDEMSRMMEDPEGKAFIVEMMDQAFRSSSSSRTADQISYLLSRWGIPRFLQGYEKWGMRSIPLFGALGVPLMKYLIRKKTSQVIFPGEEKALKGAILKQGVRVNLNHLGEAILGEEEAEGRLEMYLKDLEKDEVDYISVKISTLYSQINLLSQKGSLDALCIPYKKLLLKAFPKFVNLDMEEYKDLHLTVALFKQVHLEEAFLKIPSGIVLQSYLPDSYPLLLDLLEFAKKRAEMGGAWIKIRIVKGANLAMEKVESSLKGWPQAPYETKAETDANFIRMVDAALASPFVKVGIGSHNLFDIAYALILGKEMTIEMLMGMSEPARRVIKELAPDMLLYCPAARKEEFQNAIAYLVRRLDENTGEENFLRAHFHLIPGSKAWRQQAERFAASVLHSKEVSFERRRTQNRNRETYKKSLDSAFRGEPDTDWALPENVQWAEKILTEWRGKKIPDIPAVIGGQEIFQNGGGVGIDPSFPDRVLYRYHQASSSDIERSLKSAKSTGSPCLEAIAEKLREGRAALMGAMAADVGKSLYESDVEVSEAIDFALYYAQNLKMWRTCENLILKPKGTILVASPWNFPCSIPAGGILAALAAGNAVIFKPAPEAVLVGYELVKLFWEAGVSKEVLQFVPCKDEQGSLLVQDPRIAAVVLTGATDTAKMMLKMRPGLDLIAETGGKNCIIVSKMADLDLAIKDIIQSAFAFSGQKCSACSLVILEAEVYDNPRFKSQLKSAAASLAVGSQWDPASKITPLIRPPEGPLKRALENQGDQAEWLLKPSQHANFVSPGIKWGVKPGSFLHQTELFGPVIGVMRAENLQEAISFANGTQYGLTSGLHSLDVREHAEWLHKIHTGNCYINRGITGAIVERQPFGGAKASSFGKGAKAGGPNYLLQMMQVEEKGCSGERAAPPSEVDPFLEVAKLRLETLEEVRLLEDSVFCYSYFWKHFFSKSHDPMKIFGQDNLQMYVAREHVELRVCGSDLLMDILRVAAASMICNTPLFISIDRDRAKALELKNLPLNICVETDQEFMGRISGVSFPRVRLLQKPAQELVVALSLKGLWLTPDPVHANGRIELLHYLREVSLSYDYHRYGNVTRKIMTS
jgi:RHH-type transcriptional regulator, proline utilization regulon repressor / proline dehydrogenase / delta 1-pyrroline-5-carboxylate dehydrogenase